MTSTPIAENEQICEKLLGWIRSEQDGDWITPDRFLRRTPAFDKEDWGDAGLILTALSQLGQLPRVWQIDDGEWFAGWTSTDKIMHVCRGLTGPLAIKAAGLRCTPIHQ